jgi:hypothetical protein
MIYDVLFDMGKRFLLGLLIGLIISVPAIYAWESKVPLIDRSNIEGPFFLVITVLYIPIGIWAIIRNFNLAFAIILAGTIAIIIIYLTSIYNYSYLLGMKKPDGIASLAIISKVYQSGIIIISIWLLYTNRIKERIVAVK